MKMLDAALGYAKKGWAVFPCEGKIPATAHGVKDATTDESKIREWWGAKPQANIGIACGRSSNLIVLDVDGDKGGFDSLGKLWDANGPFQPIIPEVRTGTGGRHYYFKYQDGIGNRVEFMPGLDIRSEGGYVIAPPSIHPNGTPYSFEPKAVVDMLFMPDYLHTLLFRAAKPALTEVSQGASVTTGRHAYLMQVAGALARRGVTPEALEAALQAENQAKCNPPVHENDVRRMVESAMKYPVEAPIIPAESTSDLIRASELAGASLTYLRDKDKVKGMPTGLDGLDKMLGGGHRLGEVTCWHAEAKTGKNTLWHYLMYLWLELDIPIAYASRELSPEEEVLPNLFSVATGANAWLSNIDSSLQKQYDELLSKWPLYFSQGYGYFPQSDLREWIDKGIEVGIKHFWFDHLHYMLEDPEDHKTASILIKNLKSYARLKGININIIIQPNKLQDGQRLSLNSIKGGAAMGQAIDNLLILERVKQEGIKNVSKLTLEVARSKLCKPGSIYLQFDPDSTRFVETEQVEEKPEPLQAPLINDDIPVADRGKSGILTHRPFKTLL